MSPTSSSHRHLYSTILFRNFTEEPYKAYLCKKYTKYGKCKFGSLCPDAHGEQELNLFSTPRYLFNNSTKEKRQAFSSCIQESSFCSEPETRIYFSVSPSKQNEKMSPPKSFHHHQQQNLNIKTVLCKNYSTKHGCKYGSRCDFAHGDQELHKMKPKSSTASSAASSNNNNNNNPLKTKNSKK